MLLKKPNTLNYPILFWNIAKFFQIVFRYLKHLDRLIESNSKLTAFPVKMPHYKRQKSSISPQGLILGHNFIHAINVS